MTTPLTGNWNYPTLIRFGAGRIVELPQHCGALGMQRPLLVTDAGLAALPMVARAVAICRDAGLRCEVFSDVQPNPIEANVTAGVAAFRRGGHDGVIAFGGGSALDTGKGVALMVGQSRPIWDFEDREDWFTRVDVAGMAPVVAVPTTAGTGSEVGRASVFTDLRDHMKKIIFHPRMMPAIVIEDPELCVGLPPQVTAAVGMDALSHNLEAYCAPGYHPMADGVAVEGMRLVKEWLPRAVHDGADLEARAHMLVASSMGATAFQKGLGAMHSLSHPCSANLGTHHGLTNAVVMPYVLEWNRAAIDAKLARLAASLGLGERSYAGVQGWVLELRREIGIPHTLADLGVRDKHAPAVRTAGVQRPVDGRQSVADDGGGFRAAVSPLHPRRIDGELSRDVTGSPVAAARSAGGDHVVRIAVGGFQHETNTFSPVAGDAWRISRRRTPGPACRAVPRCIAAVRGINLPTAGFIEEAASLRHEACCRSPGVRRSRRVRSPATPSSASRPCCSRTCRPPEPRRWRLPRPARRHGDRTPAGRGRRIAAPRARARRPDRADRCEPRLSRQPVARRWRRHATALSPIARIRMWTWRRRGARAARLCTTCCAGEPVSRPDRARSTS